MKKYSKKLAFLVLIAAVTLTLFTGCENFMSGSSLKEELQDMIDYQYADYININLDFSNEEGTAKTSTNLRKKPTDSFTLGFSPNTNYAFIGWQINCMETNSEQRSVRVSEITENEDYLNKILEIMDLSEDGNGNYTISAKIKKDAVISSITVKPLVTERPKVKSATPAYDPNSTSRQTAIVVQFSQPVKEDSFRFSTAELEQLGVIVMNDTTDEEGNISYRDADSFITFKDEDGKYYAYKSTADNFTYFKNIEITTDQGIKSVADSFNAPVLENLEDSSDIKAILTITPYSAPEKLIEIGNAGYKTIIVNLSKQIQNTEGIEFAADYSWGYQVNEETPQKARIVFDCNSTEGTLDSSLPVDVTKYSLSQRISLGFTEDPDYQFLRWDFDETYLSIPDYKKPDATALVLKETPEGNTTSIRAVCAPRLKLDEENVNTGTKLKDGSDAVYRNSSLQIAFTHGLPPDDTGIKQLDNINITIGGTSVRQCFMTPSFIDERTILFASDRNNRLEVPDGQTKTITVSIPADLYYEYEYKEEKYKVTLGKEKSFSYIVSYETDDNAEVTFGVVSTSAGTITPSGQKSYAIGKKVAMKFEAKEGWIFNGWKITSADEEMNSKVKIASPSSAETELEIFDEIKGVIITADCTEMLKVEKWNLTNTSSDSDGTAEKPAVKDTGIEIKFNKPLDEANKLKEIKIYADGNDCTSMYSKSLSEDKKTVTVTNTKRLSVEKNAVKTVTVSVPKSFYCIENGKKITMSQDASYSYSVNYKTTEKAKITFSIINGETGKAFETDAVPGTLMPFSYNEYYLDETVSVSFAENAGYQFYKWDYDSSLITLTGKGAESELKVNGAAETSVKAVVYERPSVMSVTVNGTELSETEIPDPFDKDSEIVIKLAHEIDADSLKKITVTYTGDNYSQKDYFKTVYDRINKTVTFSPLKILTLRNGYENETVTVTIPADIYYIHKYKDSERTTILASGSEDITRSYKVRNATKNKTQITYSYSSGSLKANNSPVSNASFDYSTDESISLQFTVSSDSVFTGWRVSCASGTSYVISNENYAESGTITVKDSSGNLYFTLQIDSQEPSKATAKTNGYISTGITLSASERLVAKVNDTAFTPKYVSAGVNCDTPIVIPFNKAMNSSTLTLYDEEADTGSIQIVNRESTGTHYEKYYEITASGWNGNNLTVSPKANVYEILDGLKTADLKVILNAQTIKDADGKVLEGITEYSYRLNPETEDSTYIQFNLNGCTVKVDGAIDNAGVKEYSIGTKLEIECIPDENNKFSLWSLEGTSSEYVEIEDDSSSKTILKVKKTMGDTVVNVLPQKILLPKINSSSVEPSYTAAGVNCNTSIVIPFNKEIKKETVSLSAGSIQIVNKDNDNTHYEQYFEQITSSCWSGNTLTITPKVEVYKILGNASTADIKVILGSGITDNESSPNVLAGTTSFTYRINSTTSTKTKIQFTVGGTNCSVSLNGTEYSSTQTVEYNIGQKVELQFIPNDGYKYSSYELTNNTDNSVTIGEKAGKYEIQVTKAVEGIVNLMPVAILLPKVNTALVTPSLKKTGVECDTEIVIPFNKEIKTGTVSLYDKDENPDGTIQIVDESNENTHYEKYFCLKNGCWSGNTLTISPETDVYKILENSTTADIKVIFGSGITDNESSPNALAGTTSFTYRINSTTSTKTKIQFTVGGTNCSVSLNGTEYSSTQTVEYNIGQKVELQFIPNEGYKYSSYELTNNTSGAVSKTELGSGKYELKVTKATSDIITLTPSVILLPKVIETSVTPVLKTTGVECDTEIVIPFNKEIKTGTVSLYDKDTNPSGTIQIVDAGNNNTHYEQYFKAIDNSCWDGNTLTISPKDDVYKILEKSSTADIKVILGNGITDTETSSNALTETRFTYRINETTSTTTKIKFAVTGKNCSVKIDGDEYSADMTVECYVGQKIEVLFIPADGYKYSNYSMTNNTSEVVSKTELGSGKYELQVTKSNANVITLTPSAILLPKVNEEDITPVLMTTGVNCDTNIVIPFNKEMNTSTVTLYNNITKEGSIQIVDAGNSNTHYESYYEIASWNGNTLTITPKENVYEIFGTSSLADIKVILGNDIKDTATSPNALTGTTSFTYKINKNTTKQTYIKFASDSHIRYIIKGDEYSGNKELHFNIGETFTVELIVDSGYTYNGPTTNARTEQYYTLESKALSKVYTVTTKKDNLFEENPYIPEFKMTSEIMPYVSTSTPEYSVEGVSMDTPIVIKFTRKMASSKLNNSNINIFDENGANVDEYFEDPIVSDGEKTVTIKPKGSKISELFENMSKRIFKVKLWYGINGYNTSFTLKDYYGDEGYIKTICYNNTRSNAKPEVIAISFKNEENGTEFVETAIKTNEESIDNHAGSSVWIECKATDSGSGVKDLIIEEYLLNNKNGETSNFSAINNVNTTMTFINNIYIYSSKFRYDFKSPEDGLVKLVVKAVNYAGNQTEHPLTFYFTKDCIVDCENYYLTNSNGITCFASKSTNNYSTMTNLKTKTNTMSFHYLQDRWTSRTGRAYKQFPDIVLKTSQDKSLWTNVTPSNYTEETTAPYDRHYDFTIDNDVKYIKAIITDTVGNTKETVYQLPETEVSKTSLISGGIRFVLDTADVDMDPIIAKQTNYLLRSSAQSTDTLVTSDTSTFYHNANETAGNNITLTTNYLTTDKYYTIYSVSCYEYYDASGNKQYIYGHPARYSSTVRLPSTYSYSKGSSSTYIPRFNTSLAVGPRNSNSYELSVTITNKANLADNGKYQFIVLINNTYDSTKNFESSYVRSVYYFDNGTSITIPMNYSLRNEYYVNVVALNQETGLYYQADPVCVRTDKDVVTPQLLYFTGLSGNGSYIFTSDYSEIKFYVTEDYGPNAGYLMDEDGNVFVDYWLVPYKKEWGTLNLDTIFTTEYIENLTFPTYHTSFNWNNFEWDFNDEECRTLNIPLQGIPYGKYVLVTKVYDKNGNFKCSADGILQTADIQCHYESLETEYNEGTGIDVNLGDDGDFIIRWGAFDKVNRKWIEDENYMDGHDYTVEMDSTGSHFTSARIDTNGLGEGIDFIRFTIAHHDSNSRNVQYIGPYYVLLGSDVSDYLKDIDYFDNTRASIYCSEPCIIETLMSTENYSSVEEWNRHAMRASPKQFDASGMYTIDTTKASAGEYYCVMAHFADGTNKMTEVRQK